jgi:CRISPR-associated endonuclease Csn1
LCPLEVINPKWRHDIEERLKSIIVSCKPDHGKEGKLYAETALAKHLYLEKINIADLKEGEINCIASKAIQDEITLLVQKEGFKKAKTTMQKKYNDLQVFRDKWVTRKPLVKLSESEISNICDLDIREKVLKYVKEHPVESGEKLQDVLARCGKMNKMYTIRYFYKDQVPVSIASCDNSKAYIPGDYYRVDIWRIPDKNGKYKYKGVFISRPDAMWQKLHGVDIVSLHKQKPHKAAKLIMRLCKDDVVKLSSDNVQEFCRIAGFSATDDRIDIQPIYASDTIADWIENTHINLTSAFWPSSNKGHYYKKINALFNDYEIKQVKITVDGRFSYRS